jgi:hypothetical protein
MKAVHLDVQPYGSKLHVCYDSEGWNEIRKMLIGRDTPLPPWTRTEGLAETYDVGVKGQQHIIMRFDMDKVNVGIIAHEAFHAAMSVCDHVGILVHAHSDEPAAYLAQWFADVAWHHLPEGKKR